MLCPTDNFKMQTLKVALKNQLVGTQHLINDFKNLIYNPKYFNQDISLFPFHNINDKSIINFKE